MTPHLLAALIVIGVAVYIFFGALIARKILLDSFSKNPEPGDGFLVILLVTIWPLLLFGWGANELGRLILYKR
jgi:hypothetical protein